MFIHHANEIKEYKLHEEYAEQW